LHLFSNNRKILIVTKHGKEEVIQPPLYFEFGLQCFVSSKFDTDTLGTFSGETKRILSPHETALKKCKLALDTEPFDMAISSEGSFGPHPLNPFLIANEEILCFYDRKNKLEIFAKEITTETNFNTAEINTWQQLCSFAHEALFPSHALILRDALSLQIIKKGISNWDELEKIYKNNIKKNSLLKIETDMRAHLNPTRMKQISKCVRKLIDALKSNCPKCNAPGFVINNYEEGLPCKICEKPTRSVLKTICKCNKCLFAVEKLYPRGNKFEDPMYCDYCNP
jgi:hypothetical protein